MDDMEDYGFEYSDEEAEEQDVDVENQYYNSKGLVETDPEGALAGFSEVVRMEPEKGEWGFKALKQTVKLYYRLGKYKDMMDAYREMLTYIKSAVTRNYSEKSMSNIMDFVSGAASQNSGFLQEFYQTTLKALEEAKNERLWFKTNLKLCKIWFDIGEYGPMNKEVYKSCRKEDGTDDQKKGTQLLEVYAIEIQMYTETKNNKKLKQLYQKALSIKSAIPHPRIMGIIRECGGKMHMAERQWAEAATDFFEAFKNYDEAGNQRRIQTLKYLVLANMLMESEVNPFDGQEAKPYKNDPEILAMTNLIGAYQRNEILAFEKTLKTNRSTIMDDPFIRMYIEDLLKKIRNQVLLKLIRPYTRIWIPFISKELNVPANDVEQLLVSLILDNRIHGHIDQVNQLLEHGDSLYNNIHHPSKLAVGADFYCFKQQIQPKWEDPVCANGGKWTISFPRGKADACWLYTLLAMIGEQFNYGDSICGAVVNVRAKQEKLSLWTKDASNETAQVSIGKQWKEFLDYNDSVGFIFHEDAKKHDRSAKNRYSI